MLAISPVADGEILVVRLTGPLDTFTAGDFKAWLYEKAVAGFRGFAIDCTKLAYLSSGGIGAFSEVQASLLARGGSMVLFGLSAEVTALLRFTGVIGKLVVAESETDAISRLKSAKAAASAPEGPPPSPPPTPTAAPELRLPPDPQPVMPPSGQAHFVAGAAQPVAGTAPEEFRNVGCPHCGATLRVSKPGKYLCPACRNTFQYKN